MRKISRIHLIGCQLQETAATIKEAKERMARTCGICSRRGGVYPCSSCVVLVSHHRTVSVLKTLEEIKRRHSTYVVKVKGTITLDMQIKERRCDNVRGCI